VNGLRQYVREFQGSVPGVTHQDVLELMLVRAPLSSGSDHCRIAGKTVMRAVFVPVPV